MHSSQAERAASKRDAFLKKKGAAGSGSASGGESEQGSSVPSTPRDDHGAGDPLMPLAGGIVTVSEEDASDAVAIPQAVEARGDAQVAAGEGGADALHQQRARVPAVEGLSDSSAMEKGAESPRGGSSKRNSSQRRTGKTSSGTSPR